MMKVSIHRDYASDGMVEFGCVFIEMPDGCVYIREIRIGETEEQVVANLEAAGELDSYCELYEPGPE